MTTIKVYVVSRDAGPYMPGTAHVELDGRLIAKLRTSESIEIEVGKPTISTSVDVGPLLCTSAVVDDEELCPLCHGSLDDGRRCAVHGAV